MESRWGSAPIDSILRGLASGPGGLSAEEAERRLHRYGPNSLRGRETALLLQFLARFSNPLVVLLLLASAISALTGDVASFSIISAMVAMSVTLDFVQEYRAGRAAEALRATVGLQASALRDGAWLSIPVERLVPGDVVAISAGARIPADGRLLEGRDLFVNQALLTGEPYPVEKQADERDPATDPIESRAALFMGTSVISGTGALLICRTGRATMLGDITARVASRPPPNAFEIGTRQFGMLIMRLTVLLSLLVLLANTLLARPWLESFLFATALAVGLTPELLPMVVSLTLARGALRMAGKKVVVKQLAAIHNLGCMDVLCTDKTGTLTEGRIRLERHENPRAEESEYVLRLVWLNSHFESGLKTPMDEAILAHETMEEQGWVKLDEIPFDFERRRVSVLVERGARRILIVKGAPEELLALSTGVDWGEEEGRAALDEETASRLLHRLDELADDGFRVLGVAWRELASPHATVADESGLVFAGLAAFLDPPRTSASTAVERLRSSGVAVKIVTGDNERVTRYVCGRLGLPIDGVLTGADVSAMDDAALQARAETTSLFCRMRPAEKNRVILALKARGHVTGYLGDGINDAPSLHSADVGISVDDAVDVARDAAHLILLESDLGVLHDGVIEGRITYGNVMKYVMMATSSNFGNMFSMAAAAAVLPFLPMLPLQILLNNLLYDISEMPIPTDRVDPEELARPPRWDTAFIRRFMLAVGPVSSLFDFLTFYVMLAVLHAHEALFHTGWFVESLTTQVLVIFVIRTRRNPLRSTPSPALALTSLGVVATAVALPCSPLAPWLGFVAPPMRFYAMLAAMAVAYLATVEWVKRAFYSMQAAKNESPRSGGNGTARERAPIRPASRPSG
jgi:Mg2+-importing ATPase